jgi:hypothetical protein
MSVIARCASDEAMQSTLSWIASLSLAMTGDRNNQ